MYVYEYCTCRPTCSVSRPFVTYHYQSGEMYSWHPFLLSPVVLFWCYLVLYRKAVHRYSSSSDSSGHNYECTEPSVPVPPPSLASRQPAPKKVKTGGPVLEDARTPITAVTVTEPINQPSSSGYEHRQSSCSTQPSEQCSVASPALDSLTPSLSETGTGLCRSSALMFFD